MKIIGVIGVILGVILGIYVGLWLCFIGGITGLITAVTAIATGGGVLVGLISWSILKIMLAGLLGYVSAMVIIFPSWAMIALGVIKK